jgi:CheY-like chemotaxis protein
MAQAAPNILVVEDDRETRTLIAKYLRNNACNVTTATDGREMARAMTDHRVDSLRGLHRRLRQNFRIFALPPDGEIRRIGIALPDGAMISANLMPDQRRPPFLGGPWMMTLLYAVISVTLLGLWAARADGAAVVVGNSRRKFQPQRRRGPAARTRAGGNSLPGKDTEPDAGAHHRPNR